MKIDNRVIVVRYQNGESTQDIAYHTHLSPAEVNRVLRSQGVQVRPKGRYPKYPRTVTVAK